MQHKWGQYLVAPVQLQHLGHLLSPYLHLDSLWRDKAHDNDQMKKYKPCGTIKKEMCLSLRCMLKQNFFFW